MTEKKPADSFLWTPPEKIDENVRRMAWLLFLEWWKASANLAYERKAEGLSAFKKTTIRDCYADCLAAAKIVRAQELQPTVKIEPDVPEDQA